MASMKVSFLETAPAWMKVAATVVFGALFYIAFRLSVWDYQTSVIGYQLLPSRKLEADTAAALIGLLPQLLQIAMGWVAASRARGRRLALLLMALAFTFDFITDLQFKMDGLPGDFGLAAITVIETLALFTLGSEFLLLFSWSNLSPLFLPALMMALRNGRAYIVAAWQEAKTVNVGGEVGGLFNIGNDANGAAEGGGRSRGGKK